MIRVLGTILKYCQGQSSMMVKCQFQKMLSHCVFYYSSVRRLSVNRLTCIKKMYSCFSDGSLFFSHFLFVGQAFTILYLYHFTVCQLVFLTHLSSLSISLFSEAPFGNTVATMLPGRQHPEQLINDNNMVNTETSCFPLDMRM